MSYFTKIKNFFSRILVYQMVFLWLYMKFSQIDKSANDFKTRLVKTLNHFNIKGELINFLFDDPVAVHLLMTLSEFIFSIMAIFGSRLGAWMVALHFSITTFLFFNPFLPENSFSIFKFDIRHDMLTSFGVVFCFYLIAYYPYDRDSNSSNHIIDEIDDDDFLLETNKLNHGNTKKSRKQ